MKPKRDFDQGVNDPRGNIRKLDPKGGSHGYSDIPPDEPGLMGGPTTESVPGTHASDPLERPRHHPTIPYHEEENDGGEGVLSGRPRETGGERP